MINSAAGRLLRILLGVLLIAGLTSCGLKGDLYLPEPEKTATDSTPEKAVGLPGNTELPDETDEKDEETVLSERPGIATSQP
jgi:predicted small lipoprotein YifL